MSIAQNNLVFIEDFSKSLSHSTITKQHSDIAEVIEVDSNGRACLLKTKKTFYKVISQADHVSALDIGDEVYFINKENGAYIIGSFKKQQVGPAVYFEQIDAEHLQLNFGKLTLNFSKQGELIIKSNQSHINIDKQGSIKISGEKNIAIKAKQRIDLG